MKWKSTSKFSIKYRKLNFKLKVLINKMYIFGSARQRNRGYSDIRTFLLVLTGPKERRERILKF